MLWMLRLVIGRRDTDFRIREALKKLVRNDGDGDD